MRGPSDDTSDEIMETLGRCIAADSVGGIVTGFVVMATFVDADGDRRIYCNTARDMRCHETLGLLQYGLAVESERAARTVLDEDDDE